MKEKAEIKEIVGFFHCFFSQRHGNYSCSKPARIFIIESITLTISRRAVSLRHILSKRAKHEARSRGVHCFRLSDDERVLGAAIVQKKEN